MSLYREDAAPCGECSRPATVVTPLGLRCDPCCPEEHKPQRRGESVMDRVERTLDTRRPADG